MAERLSAKSAWKLNNALRKSAATKPTKVGTARVTRRDSDGSVWVRLPGSNIDTPVNGQILSDAQVGDTVSVRIENGRLSLMGNASTPSVGQQQVNTTVQPVRQTADNALETASTAQTAAELATSYAAAAQADADRAKDAADDAQTSADTAQASANTASSAAQSALLGLSTVEDVVDTLTWITKHGTMTLTTDTTVDPSKVYFVPDASGQYVVGGSTYSIVQNPTTEGLSGYYELTIDKSVENYIATHVSVTNEGLWLTPTSSNGYRVLIATGAGSTYTTAGTYIINASGTVVAQFTTTNARVGREGGSHVNIETDGVSIHGSDASVGVTISATSGVESVYGTERLNGNALRAYADDAGYTTRDYDQRSFLVGSGRSLTAGSPLHVVLKEGSGTGTQEWIVRFVAGTSESVTLNPLNKAGYTLSYGGGRSIQLRRTSAAESQDLEQYYRLYEVRYYEQLHAPMISMGSTDSSGAPFTTRLGEGLLADGDHQAVFGKFNEADPNDQYALIVGNGTDDDSRSNALTVDWDGVLECGGVELDTDVAPTELTLSDASVAYSDSTAPVYSRYGHVVNVCGAVKPASEVAAGGTLSIGTLPEGFRPPVSVSILCQGSNNAVWLLQVGTSGGINASRYRNGTTNAAITTSTWLPFNVTFVAETL